MIPPKKLPLKQKFLNEHNLKELQKNMWKPTKDVKNEGLAMKGLFYGTRKPEFECAEPSQPFRLSAEDLLRRYQTPPKDEDLITPFRGRLCAFIPPFGVLFELESGNFEIFFRVGSGKPSIWQRLWLRFRVWRMRRKVRKALRQK